MFLEALHVLRKRIEGDESLSFEEKALEVFRFQARHNLVYREWLGHLGTKPNSVKRLEEVPFLPVRFFKSKKVLTLHRAQDCPMVFESSGTTGQSRSQHYIADPPAYEQNALRLFREQVASPEESHFFFLLPSYLERSGASLVYMAETFFRASDQAFGGFYALDYERFEEDLALAKRKSKKPIVLLGVTFALLELARRQTDLSALTLIETGGMKGQGRELVRAELHERLRQACRATDVRSEYGMTELLSQSYTPSNSEWFPQSGRLQVLARPLQAPNLPVFLEGQTGLLQCVDLANLHSCAFLGTEDLGIVEGERFKVLGRMDASEPRGCNMLYQT